MVETKGSYRQIFKATSLFGGVQVFNIIIGIVRSKIVAVLLGPMGMGVLGLYTTTIAMIQSASGLGLSSSAVREISEAKSTGNAAKISSAIKALRRWVWFTGLLGVVVTVAFASHLSQWTFGNDKYTWAFYWLSLTLLLNALSSGQNALLQGMRHLKDMAKSSMLGSLVGLLASIPLYYLYGLNGLVPGIIITAAVTLMLSTYFARKVRVEPVEQTWKQSYANGVGMAKLGVAMMASGLLVTLVSYATNLFVSRNGSIDDVGMYRAAWTISSQYVGLIFTAMATDFFPRLASLNSDKRQQELAVNQQAEIAFLILGPMLVFLIGFAPFLIKILYTKEFLPIEPIICWNMLGIPFKAASWVIGFMIIARGNSKLYFTTEILANASTLLFNVLGYHFFGLVGLGVSFFLSYLFYAMLMIVLSKKHYGFRFNKTAKKIFVLQLVVVVASFLQVAVLEQRLAGYIIVAILFMLSGVFSLSELNRRLNIKELLGKYRKR